MIKNVCIIMVIIFSFTTAAFAGPLKKIDFQTKIKPMNLKTGTGKPTDSILNITGKIDLGSMDYYSAEPDIIWVDMFDLGQCFHDPKNAYLNNGDPTPVLSDISMKPQLKNQEQYGYSFTFYFNTGKNPLYWECYKALTNVTIYMGKIKVRTSPNAPVLEVNAVYPKSGTQVKYTVGPVMPK